jgi:hypothetical protein
MWPEPYRQQRLAFQIPRTILALLKSYGLCEVNSMTFIEIKAGEPSKQVWTSRAMTQDIVSLLGCSGESLSYFSVKK